MPPAVPPGPGRHPSTVGGAVYLLVLAATIAGLVLVALGPWRRGTGLIGVAMLVAAGTRSVLGEGDSGMLRVRSRWFDVVALAAVGALTIALSVVIPDQPA